MVEFALLAPIFFGLIFAIIQAGLLLYVYNSSQHAVTVGAEVVAADGSVTGGDSHAITSMRNTDFGQSQLVDVQQYDLYLLDPDGSQTRDTHSCGGAACHQTYNASGALTAGNWPPGSRHTDSANADYVELDVTYNYQYFFAPGAVVHLTSRRVFRLEPQS